MLLPYQSGISSSNCSFDWDSNGPLPAAVSTDTDGIIALPGVRQVVRPTLDIGSCRL